MDIYATTVIARSAGDAAIHSAVRNGLLRYARNDEVENGRPDRHPGLDPGSRFFFAFAFEKATRWTADGRMLGLAMFAILLAAASTFIAPSEPLKGQLYSAIWADLELNAWIGNGNWLASRWYQAGGDTPDLHIQQLECAKISSGHRCEFNLYRDGGPKVVLNEITPDQLSCNADFTFREESWHVVHTPPRGSGHTKTSLRCKVVD